MKFIKIIAQTLLALFLLVVAACNDSNLTYITSVDVKVSMPTEIKVDYAFSNKEVILRSDRLTYTATTDENGVAHFSEIVPDIYNIYCSWELDGDQYVEMSNTAVEHRPALISATLTKNKIFDPIQINIQTLLSVKQKLLISKIYASGTRYPNNSVFHADNYVEIFNNSDEVQYLDGFFLALVEGDSPAAFPSKDYADYVHARQVYRFPGAGTDYPVDPGKSVVIANSAYNHTLAVPRSVNLEDADFEFKGSLYNNNDFVMGMDLIYSTYVGIRQINLQRGGVNGLCLFEDDIANVINYPILYVPGKTSGNMFIRIPAKNVVDGVEVLSFRTTGIDVNLKRVPAFIDASYTNISSTSGYNNESMERKVDKTRSTSDRVYLIDTNNSQNDFVKITTPTPRDYTKSLLNQ